MRLPRAVERGLLGLKAFFIRRGERTPEDYGGRHGLTDYAREVGEGYASNVIMAPVMWIMRTFTEAHAIVESRTKSIWEPSEDHAVEVLIDRPNESYDGDALWKATLISYTLNGNAYWRKIRNVYGDVIALWYTPHWMLTPRWPLDGSQFITQYDYFSGLGPPYAIAPRDLVHFRFGLNPENPRLGYSPLRPLLREVFTDDEAATFSTKILQNMGVPGLMVSPKNDAMKPTDDDVKELKAYMTSSFSGANRGKPMVMKMPTEVAQFGFDPNKLMLGALRDISEERVCAALGLPASVVGFGSGLESTKVGATMRELRRLAWVQCLIPMQKSLANQLTAQLLPDFVSQTRRFRVRFDVSDVSAFQEEDDLRAQRVARLVQAGVLRVDRAQEMIGLEVDPKRKVYLQPTNSLAIDEQGNPILPPAAPSPTNPAGPDPAATPAEEPPAGKADQDLMAAIAARRGFHGNGDMSHGA